MRLWPEIFIVTYLISPVIFSLGFILIKLCVVNLLFPCNVDLLCGHRSRTRMPNKHVYYHRSPYHWNHTILTLTFGFDREDDVYHFAFTYPYSYSKCQAHLEILERKKIPHLRRELLSNSVVSAVLVIYRNKPSSLYYYYCKCR